MTSGEIFLDETEITKLKDKKLTQLRRDRIGFIFQAFNLLPTLNALENITLPMDIAGRKPDADWLRQVVETVGLAERLKHHPTQLSGGQQQRVAVARALAARPEIIFGDEPTGNLDSRAGAEVLPPQVGRRAGPDHRHGHPRPRRRLLRGPGALPRRRLHRRRDVQPDRGPGPRPHEALRRTWADVMTVWKTSMRNFFAHKGRMALSAVAVLLSVAFVCGTLVFTDTMNTTFDKLFAVSSPDVTVSPKGAEENDEQPDNGKPASLPASLVQQVEKAEGVKKAEGAAFSMAVTVVNSENKNMGSETGAPTIASNWTDNDLRSMEITSGHAPRGPTEVMVDGDTAKKHKLKIGDELRTIAVTGDIRAKISGIASFTVTNPGAAVVYLDTATAQKHLLGAPDVFTQVLVTAESGVSDTQLKKNVAAALDGSAAYRLQTQQEAADANKDSMGAFLDVMKYAMLGFAGIAFLVGIFLIVNTFSMLVAQRTRGQIGLMRAIGSSRKQVNRSVLLEAVLLGIVGSVLGVAAGIGLAVGLMKLMGAVGMELSTRDLTVAWTTPVIGLVLGVVVTVLAAYIPARRAGKVSPMAALRDAGTPADAKSAGSGPVSVWSSRGRRRRPVGDDAGRQGHRGLGVPRCRCV
ncbi:Macrolide export ATP-binding/permease protein MacB [Streptomyces microflavus]